MGETIGWLEALESLALGIVGTVLGVLCIYFAFRPRIVMDEHVRLSNYADGRPPVYRVRFYNRTRFRLTIFDLKIDVTVRVPPPPGSGIWVRVPVPLSVPQLPSLRRSEKSDPSWSTPRLLVEEINWAEKLGSRAPKAQDFRAALEELGANVGFYVVATTSILQVTRVASRTYTATDFEARIVEASTIALSSGQTEAPRLPK